jgi:hypothetical protein
MYREHDRLISLPQEGSQNNMVRLVAIFFPFLGREVPIFICGDDSIVFVVVSDLHRTTFLD